MEKKIEFSVTEAESGKTIRQILKTKIGLTSREIRQIKFRENGVRKNGIPARCTEQVVTGDILILTLESPKDEGMKSRSSDCLSDSELSSDERSKWIPNPGSLDVLYEDEDILIVNKPSGMPSHPSPGHYADTLANRVAWYLTEHGQEPDIHMAGRLDKDTSGVMVFAKNSPAAARLAKQREDGRLKKEYLAWVKGSPEPKEGTIDAPIGPVNGELNRMEVRSDGTCSVTHYQVVGEKEGYSLLHITLEQGRTHQIRVHMSSVGHPLAGDPIYGQEGFPNLYFQRLALHAWRLTLEQPFRGEPITVEAECPLFPILSSISNINTK